jgi:hypothetical protein
LGVYCIHTLKQQEIKMTQVYDALTEAQKREVRMYGVTVEGMRQSVESSLTFRFSGPAMMAASIMSDCQEMLSSDNGGSYDFMVVEDVRQALNRAKWILFEYATESKS